MYKKKDILKVITAPVAIVLFGCQVGSDISEANDFELQDYYIENELQVLPEGKASLYRAPWRSNLTTASAHNAKQGAGIYYKYSPADWTLEEHEQVMTQLAEAGIRRLGFAPHWAIHVHEDWEEPRDGEKERLIKEASAARRAGIRPRVGFPFIAPFGEPGTDELQEWWGQGELMPAGEVGSAEFEAYQDKVYEVLTHVIEAMREAGFTEPNSFDICLGLPLWWGAPSVNEPPPGATVEDLRPGGRIHEFTRGLMQKVIEDGYEEPSMGWHIHHHFEDIMREEAPPEAYSRSVNFYSAFTGITTEGWFAHGQYDNPPGTNELWPERQARQFLEGTPPRFVLAQPESWAADRSRRDNLIEFLQRVERPVGVPAIGLVPSSIPEVEESPFSGWEIKQRSAARIFSFWLNQGVDHLLLHSFYRPQADDGGEMAFAQIKGPIEPGEFEYTDSLPLRAVRAFWDGLEGAEPDIELEELSFRFALDQDPELIPPTGEAGPMRASDRLALLPFQIDDRKFAVAAYVLTPNVAEPMEPLELTLEIDRSVQGDVEIIRMTTGKRQQAEVLQQNEEKTVLRLNVYDDPKWIRFESR